MAAHYKCYPHIVCPIRYPDARTQNQVCFTAPSNKIGQHSSYWVRPRLTSQWHARRYRWYEAFTAVQITFI